MYFGAHVKSSGGVWHAIENGVELGAEAVQFFAGSPRTWKPTLYKDADWQKFREMRAESPIRFVVIHTIYLINLASENEDFYEKSVTSLCGALTAADQLGADAIVTHIGSHQGSGFAAGLERVQEGLRRALAEASEGSPVKLLLENTAGAGGTMGVDFRELGEMIDAAGGDPRLGICVDTAHIFESGYDLRTREGIDEVLRELDDACDLDRLVMFHLNDSKTPLGSNRDRHENIGEGDLGDDAFRLLVNEPAFKDLPGILEVPGSTATVRTRRTSPVCARSRADAPRLRRRHRRPSAASWVYSGVPCNGARPQTGGDAMELVTVTTVSDAGLANVVVGVLEQAGVEAVVGGPGAPTCIPCRRSTRSASWSGRTTLDAGARRPGGVRDHAGRRGRRRVAPGARAPGVCYHVPLAAFFGPAGRS